MYKALKWQLAPPTMCMWSNWYMSQWDIYLETCPYAQSHPLVLRTSENPVQFKQPYESSYKKYREFMQIIDCAVLDI